MSRVLVIPDTHCPAMLPDFPEWLEEIYHQWQCEKVIHVGDLIDNVALNFHKKNVALKNPLEEREKALKQVAKLVNIFPKAEWLLGNHDVLPWRWLDEVGIPQEYMRKPGAIWQTKSWRVHPRYTSLVVDGVIYRHGDMGKGGRMPATTNAIAEGTSVVQGHHHTAAGVEYISNSRGRLFGMQVGTGIDVDSLHFEYGRRFGPNRCVIGCGVVIDGHTAVFEPMPIKKRRRK